MKHAMRKALALLFAAAMLAMICGAALAETIWYGDMTVVRCNEWVSLRDVPGTGGKRLAKVPLYATVTDAQWDRFCGDFLYCCYQGQYGYILAEYLEPATSDYDGLALDAQLDDLRFTAERTAVGGGERLRVICTDGQGSQRWSYETSTDDMTELTLTEAFLAGTDEDPMVMVYNAMEGLTALSASGGEVLWQLTGVELGASISWAVASDGTVYIGGYYGPDPVAIDCIGNVFWMAESSDSYWLYQMAFSESEGRLTCWYDMLNGEAPGRAVYDRDGKLLEKTYD